MKRQFRFNKKAIDALPPCAADSRSKEIEYSDLEIAGLRLQVNRQGRKFFLFRYVFGGKKRAMKIGGYPEVEINYARLKVIEWRALLIKGIDPQVQREEDAKAGITFQDFFDQYLWPHVQATKRSAMADHSRFRIHILPTFGKREMASITQLEFQLFHNSKKQERCAATANRLLENIHRAYNLAIEWGILDHNPSKFVRRHQEDNKRTRYLSTEELRRFVWAIQQDINRSAADGFLFLLSTGARLNEALQAKWEHVDMENATWFLPHTKAGKSRYVVLNEAALEILRGRRRESGNPYIFTGITPGTRVTNPQRAWKRVLETAGIDPKTTRIHDLRHTHASYLTSVATLHEIASILGHSTTQMTERYAHVNATRLKEASSHVANLIAEAKSTSPIRHP